MGKTHATSPRESGERMESGERIQEEEILEGIVRLFRKLQLRLQYTSNEGSLPVVNVAVSI